MRRVEPWWGIVAPALLSALVAVSTAAALTPEQAELREIYAELVAIDTTASAGSTTLAAEAMAKRLRAAGVPAEDVHVVGPSERKKNLVARVRGKGARRPLLLLAHLDVVDARREDWSVEPFELLERDGYFYGRGSIDDKAMAAMFTLIAMRLQNARTEPDRDVILALTADEEGGPENGVEWLLENRRELVDAAVVINEGGGGRMRGDRYLFNSVQASEKSYMTFSFEVRDRGGHSSLPRRENAIYRLARALGRLEAHAFPVELNEVTRNFFARTGRIESQATAAAMAKLLAEPPDPGAVDQLSEIPAYDALLRTTCVATRLEAGHADNALPQTARATVNCRLLPGHTTDDLLHSLAAVVDDEQVEIRATEPDTSAPSSPLDAGILGTVEMVTEEMWPGVPVIATMSTGATDSRYFRRARIPAYGVSGIFLDIDDIRAHGRDERVGVKQFWEGYAFLRRLVDALSY
jgi:acetylornithine deacetylase/succinyl-diaminopimelate desuccinylase-like protein